MALVQRASTGAYRFAAQSKPVFKWAFPKLTLTWVIVWPGVQTFLQFPAKAKRCNLHDKFPR